MSNQTIQIDVNSPSGISRETALQVGFVPASFVSMETLRKEWEASAQAQRSFTLVEFLPWSGTVSEVSAVPHAVYQMHTITAKQSDDEQTAAWYGRGEKPEHEPLDWVRFELAETAKPPTPGLFVVQGEGRYQGLGFNAESDI